MKLLLCSFFLLFSHYVYAKPITMDFVTTKLSYNAEKKYYETTFQMMAGIYKADEKFFKCLQKSLQTKKEIKVSYEPMGLMITDCKE